MPDTYPHEFVNDPDYFRDVLRNMEWVESKHHRRVRFGLTGGGHYPNYQTGWPENHEMSAKVRRFSGRTHTPYHDAPLTSFDDAKLSPLFGWEEVTEMVKARL